MADVVGLLPMGGNGTRLGMPFPKPLAPIITRDGVEPIYQHAVRRLAVVTDILWAIVNSGTDRCLLRSLSTSRVGTLFSEEPLLPGALGEAGRVLTDTYGENTLVACALPDSLWRLRDGRSMANVVEAVKGDGALALFTASSDELDTVEVFQDQVVSVTTKVETDPHRVRGWGAFVVRAGALATFTSDLKDGPQLGRLDMGWAYLGEYADLGTPDRYIKWHDTRWWNG